MAILALLVLATITGIGWLSSELKPERVRPLPEGIDNWVRFFHGYEAYLDQRISYFLVSGNSMVPTFGDNDLILYVEVDPAELKVGDIIVYERPTAIDPARLENIAHRVIEVGMNGEYWFRTKGDAHSEPDWHRVWERYVHGLVIGVIYQ